MLKVASPERIESNAILRQWCAGVTGDVLSIGSGRDQDKAGACYREYFPLADRYRTSEPTPADDCDLVLDVRSMPEIASGSIDAVFCSGVLEHVDDVQAAVGECHRVLKAGGSFFVGVPFRQALHRVPYDFWRFTEFGLRWLLRAFDVRELRAIGERSNPATYWVWAVK